MPRNLSAWLRRAVDVGNGSVLAVWLVSLSAVSLSEPARAQRITSSAERTGKVSSAGKLLTITAAPDVELVRRVLSNLSLNDSQRAAAVNSLVGLLSGPSASADSVRARLEAVGLPPAAAELGARLLVDQVSRPADSQSILGAVTGSGTTDRFYTAVEVYRWSLHRVTLRIVTSVAVSGADSTHDASTASADNREAFQRRTSEVLTAVQDGGPVAVHLSWGRQRRIGPISSDFALTGTLARSGTVQGGRGVTSGASLEWKGLFARQPSNEIPDPERLQVTVRGGYRHSSQTLVTDLDRRDLWFAQLAVEGTARGAKVPVGIALTLLPKSLRTYGVGIQFFGLTGI